MNGNGTISAFQGFWAEGNAGTPQVEFRQSSKVSTSSGFAKSEPTLYSEGMFGLKMGSKMNSFSCRSKVAFNGNATRAEDEGLDIPHMPAPVEKAPELVFLSQDKKELRRQAVHSFDEEVSLPVLAKTPVKGTYTIEAENVNAIGQYECVKLIDLKTRKTYNLREQSKIRFDITEKENEDPRFNLVLSNDGDCRSATSIEDEASSGPIVNITQDQKGANVRVNLSKRQEVKLKVFDMMGRPVRETESFNAKTANKRISAPETSGIYMIVVETENDRVTKRVKF
ncbi:MAG: T9SS type A sorting domain-containing protein [Flavobacteriales bacterium]